MVRASLFAAIVASLPLTAHAQVLITEFQNDPSSANDDGEWIELQNIGTGAVSIAGWGLSDYTGTTAGGEVTTRWTFPAGTTLAAGQVIVVAKFASAAGYADNTPANLYTRAPSFECATATHDDPAVPNLTAVGGTSGLALGNAATGDAVVLRDDAGNFVSGVEYGTVDRTVPGAPAVAGASTTSLRRVANTGSTLVDFAIAVTPDPFVGFVVAGNSPPVIAGTTALPRHLVHGAALTVSATISDTDGVASAALYVATATSNTNAAGAPYVGTLMTASGRVYSATPTLGLPALPPATFHERYVRYWLSAQDTQTATASDPAAAVTAAGNTQYLWRNVVPTAPSSILDVQTMLGAQPRYRLHSARIEGVATTRRTAFVSGTTNFFVQDPVSGAAIRVFATALSATDVNPGDVVQVTGMIDQFNGLRQLGEPSLDVQVVGTAAVPAPAVHTIASVIANGEALESRLVRIDGVTLNPPLTTWPTNGNATLDDGTGTLTVRVTTIVDLSGAAVPSGPFSIVGILGQFAANNVGGYQLLPRGQSDVLVGAPDAGVVDSGELDAATPVDGGELGDGGVVVADDAAPTDDAQPATDALDTPDAAPSDDAQPATDALDTADAAPAADAAASADATTNPGADAATQRDAAVVQRDASTSRDAGSGISLRDSGGCGCNTSDAGASSLVTPALALLALAALRRRRRRVGP